MNDQTLSRAPRRTATAIALVLMTVALAGTAFYLYQAGLPGAPRIADQFRVGTTMIDRSRIAALLPDGVQVTMEAEHRLANDESEGHRAQLRFFLVAKSPLSYVGVYLGGDAADPGVSVPEAFRHKAMIVRSVSTRYTIQVQALDSIYDSQLIFLHLPLNSMIRRTADGRYATSFVLDVSTRAPALVRENARIAVATPRLLPAFSCGLLTGLVQEEPLHQSRLKKVEDLGCTPMRAKGVSTQVVSLVLPAFDVRVDAVYPQPSEAGRLRWTFGGAVSVHGSIVSINEEARGQRLLFISGIVAGLAAGLAPLAVERLIHSVKSRP